MPMWSVRVIIKRRKEEDQHHKSVKVCHNKHFKKYKYNLEILPFHRVTIGNNGKVKDSIP